MKQAGFFDVDERLKRVSDLGDPLEVMATIIDFEGVRPVLDTALARSDRSKGGRPPFDPILMFKILILQALNDLSNKRAEFLITDQLSYMRFLGLGLGNKAPDRNTIWTVTARLLPRCLRFQAGYEVRIQQEAFKEALPVARRASCIGKHVSQFLYTVLGQCRDCLVRAGMHRDDGAVGEIVVVGEDFFQELLVFAQLLGDPFKRDDACDGRHQAALASALTPSGVQFHGNNSSSLLIL